MKVVLIVLFNVFLGNVISKQSLATDYDLAMFKKSKWVNEEEVAAQVGFLEYHVSPYPKDKKGYNTNIDFEDNCWVRFEDAEKKTYSMLTSKDRPEGEFGVFQSQTAPCGVCSGLQDLAVYIETPDLKTPVRRCGLFNQNKKGNIACLKKLGFSDRCAHIWHYNTFYTRKRCFYTCIRHINSPNLIPKGTHNPCKPPMENGTFPFAEGEDTDDTDYYDPERTKLENKLSEFRREEGNKDSSDTVPALNMNKRKKKKTLAASASQSIRHLFTISDKTGLSTRNNIKRKQKGCINGINKKPACEPEQWKNGPHRLNPCLQCDECAAGPIFKKVAGRTRRWSGITSAIGRPGVLPLDHHYFSVQNMQMIKDDI